MRRRTFLNIPASLCIEASPTPRRWQDRLLSNFDYLLLVNALAGRSFQAPCQYPVFPWVVADYTSSTLDLEDPKTFRDLSKPMGAINAARLAETVARYDAFDDTFMPKFHYGSAPARDP